MNGEHGPNGGRNGSRVGRGRRRDRGTLVAVLGALALCAAGVGVYLWFSPTARPQRPAAGAPGPAPQSKPAPAARAEPPRLPVAPKDPRLVKSFTIAERFGVAHPDQIVDFDLDPASALDPGDCFMLGPDGREVPCQFIEGGRKVAVRTGLTPGEEKTWKLMTGRPPAAAAGGVTVEEKKGEGVWEIVNGMTGVRVPLTGGDVRPDAIPAPVLGIRLRDGTWTAAGPNRLAPQGVSFRKMAVTFAERGPLTTVAVVRYVFDRQAEMRNTRDGPVTVPAGECAYQCRIEVQAGQPSVLFEEDGDLDVSYSFSVREGVAPDQARYRGHHSSRKEFGVEKDGRQYRAWHERAGMDALMDLRFDRDYASSYKSDLGGSICRMALWNPWVTDSGWYWQLYDKDAPDAANLVGIFAGRASRLIGAGNSGPGVWTAPGVVRDLDAEIDASGAVHAAFARAGDLCYLRFDPSLAAGKIETVGAGLANPDLLVREDGTVVIAAFDPARGAFVVARRTGAGSFTRDTVEFDAPGAVTIADPYPYLASSGDVDLLFFYGAHGASRGGLLFARRGSAQKFTFQSAAPEPGYYRQICRPRLARLADGRVALAFADGGYAARAIIEKGATDFAAPPRRLQPSPLCFGMALDTATGTVVAGDQAGALCELAADADGWKSAAMGMAVDHHGQGPNRRTVARAADGTMLFVHGGRFFARAPGGAWRREVSLDALGLADAPLPHVFRQEAAGRFVVLGCVEGALAVCTYVPGAGATRVATVPETRCDDVGVSVQLNRGGPDASFYPRIRFQWGVFVGTKGADLGDPYAVQNIARQMNVHGGINLNKVHRAHLDFPDPPHGYGAMYMRREVIDRIIAKLRADTGGPYHQGGYHNYLYNADPSARPLVDMWRDTTGAKLREAVAGIRDEARDLLDAFVNGDGIMDKKVHYWHGGLAMSRKLVWIDEVLASDAASEDERRLAKATAVLYGLLLWDDDFVPLTVPAGVNLGTANMPIQQWNYRAMYALYLAHHPAMKERARGVWDGAREMLVATVNEHGAHMGCSHYIGAANGPLLSTLQQLKMTGLVDPFRMEGRLSKYAEFEMNFLTPPDPRFGNQRRRPAIGDAEMGESTEFYGQLATAYADVDPSLSARLMGAWTQSGRPHSGFHGTTYLKIDEGLAAADPALGSSHFEGWYSVLRSGWATPAEAAVWFVNGGWYRDHASNDLGEVIIHALNAPLSVDFGSMYSPHSPGGLIHSVVLPESTIGDGWRQRTADHTKGPRWGAPKALEFTPADGGGWVRASFEMGPITWTRAVSLVTPAAGRPVFAIQDSFGGAGADAPKVFSLTMMAEGPVQTPSGAKAVGEGFALPAGVSRLGFAGQKFDAHPQGGIDWDLYVIAGEPLEAFVAEWQHKNRQGERQHILRLRGAGAFRVVIVPFPKGARPDDVAVSRAGEVIAVTMAGASARIGRDGDVSVGRR